MEEKFCPLIKDKCHGKACVLWSKDGCVLTVRALVPVIEEEPSSPELSTLPRIRRKIPQEIKRRTEEELAEEMVEFVHKEFPEGASLREYDILHDLRDLFWIEKGLDYTYIDDPKLRLKMRKVELLAQRMLEETGEISKIAPDMEKIKEKTPEELANEAIEFVKKEFPKLEEIGLLSPIEVFRSFLRQKGIRDYFTIERSSPTIALKLRAAETVFDTKLRELQEAVLPKEIQDKSSKEIASELADFLKEKFPTITDPLTKSKISIYDKRRALQEFWVKKGIGWRFSSSPKIQEIERLAESVISEEKIKKEREMMKSLAKECVEWVKKQGLKKITKRFIDLFLMEKEIFLSTSGKDYLYSFANLKFQKESMKE